jgi:hypothetical protein
MRPRTVVLLAALLLATPPSWAATTDVLTVRGRSQIVNLIGNRGAGTPVIVSSGDGGWMHLGPHVADALAAHGCFAVGFDVKAYLRGFTSSTATLQPGDIAADYAELARYAARGSSMRPLLVGVSEGAGLSVLAAANASTKSLLAGVIVIGLPDRNELGWRWKDSWIYVTHGIPNEPTFSSAALVGHVSPLPLAAIHSTHDEFASLDQLQQTMEHATDPKRVWVIAASDHRFSDNLAELDRRLIDALTWVTHNQPH